MKDTIPKKRKRKNVSNKISPWWDYRKQELSGWLTFGDKTKNNSHLSWIRKTNTQSSYPFIDVKNQFLETKKIVKHSNNLSKQEIGDDEVLRSLKIRIKPTEDQKKRFHKIFGATRFVYNKAIDFVNTKHKPVFTKLKSEILNKEKNPEADQYPWLFDHKEVPRDAKDMAVHELCASIASTKESLKANNKKVEFEMKHRTKKDICQRFKIPNNGGNPAVSWTHSGFKFWSTKGIGTVKPLIKKDFVKVKSLCGGKGCMKTVTLKYESPGRWFMIFPHVKKKEKILPARPIIALDPGIRTFQTGYDSTGSFSEYGSGDIERIFAYGKQMDKIQSKIDKHHKEKYEDKKERIKYKNERRRHKRQLGFMRNKVQNWMKDAHWKIARDLSSKNDHIMISRFKVSDMVKKLSRKINSDNVRKMLNWGHFIFRQRLKHKSEEFNCRVHEVSEHYTSKTCGRCGNIHWNLGSNKNFKCPYCNFELDRDWNGARNIFLMNVEKSIGLVSKKNPSLEGGSCNLQTTSS